MTMIVKELALEVLNRIEKQRLSKSSVDAIQLWRKRKNIKAMSDSCKIDLPVTAIYDDKKEDVRKFTYKRI